ncbi:hypothetical protein PQR15_05180 [Streptomyces lydicus]|nr:hypothetical protein [Streptomyces lydicus]
MAVCIAASAAVALLLRADHWYWLPATATFLVKPDLGPSSPVRSTASPGPWPGCWSSPARASC